ISDTVDEKETPTMRPANYDLMRKTLINLLTDLSILSGDESTDTGRSGASHKDIIGTAKTNAAVLAAQLEAAYIGLCEPCLVFPSPADCLAVATDPEARSALPVS